MSNYDFCKGMMNYDIILKRVSITSTPQNAAVGYGTR
jgi:hypothetical protein